MIIYINGVRASKKDLERLAKDLATNNWLTEVTITKKGNISITL